MASGPKEDVYESEDLPEVDQNVFPRDESNNPNIELVHIDIDAAKKRYEGKTLNVVGVDFSDSIAKKRMKCYGSNAYVLEVVGKEYSEPETSEQKINRLTYELNELLDGLKNDTISESETLNPAAVNELLNELKSVKVAKESGTSTVLNLEKVPKKISALNEATLIPLEQRLRKLEILLGPIDSTKQPLLDALEDLKFRTEALNPTIVEGLETRLNHAMTKLQQIDEKKEKNVEGDVENNVNEVLALMNKWDASCSSLPSNVKKVQALHKLHEQAASFSERLSHLVGIRDQVEKAISSDKEMLRELQMQAKDNFSHMLKQIENLEKRLG